MSTKTMISKREKLKRIFMMMLLLNWDQKLLIQAIRKSCSENTMQL